MVVEPFLEQRPNKIGGNRHPWLRCSIPLAMHRLRADGAAIGRLRLFPDRGFVIGFVFFLKRIRKHQSHVVIQPLPEQWTKELGYAPFPTCDWNIEIYWRVKTTVSRHWPYAQLGLRPNRGGWLNFACESACRRGFGLPHSTNALVFEVERR